MGSHKKKLISALGETSWLRDSPEAAAKQPLPMRQRSNAFSEHQDLSRSQKRAHSPRKSFTPAPCGDHSPYHQCTPPQSASPGSNPAYIRAAPQRQDTPRPTAAAITSLTQNLQSYKKQSDWSKKQQQCTVETVGAAERRHAGEEKTDGHAGRAGVAQAVDENCNYLVAGGGK